MIWKKKARKSHIVGSCFIFFSLWYQHKKCYWKQCLRNIQIYLNISWKMYLLNKYLFIVLGNKYNQTLSISSGERKKEALIWQRYGHWGASWVTWQILVKKTVAGDFLRWWQCEAKIDETLVWLALKRFVSLWNLTTAI